MNKIKEKSFSSSSSSAETLASNDDLLTEILIRIPVKPLLKFQSVSKPWNNLISSTQFSFSYIRKNPVDSSKPISLFLDTRSIRSPKFHVVSFASNSFKPSTIDVSGLDSDSRLYIEQSCNGLFVCSYRIPDSSAGNDRKCFIVDDSYVFSSPNETIVFYICNPTTKQLKKVKFPLALRFSVVSVALAFDPSKSPYYKLISVRREISDFGSNCYKIDMYSSETDSWSLLGIDVIDEAFDCCFPVYCHNGIHWISNLQLYFDVEMKSIKQMPKPPSLDSDKLIEYFGESGGHLHIAMGNFREIDIYEMANDYSQWCFKSRVDIVSVPWKFSMSGISILSIACGEKANDATITLYVDGIILVYELARRSSKMLCYLHTLNDELKDDEELNWRNAFPYFECLYSL